ncbi:Glutathione synthetase [Savitreella phatthalungensis]
MSELLSGLSAAEIEHLRFTLIDWCLAHGLVVRPQPAVAAENRGGCLACHAPVALHPTPFPRACFNHAYAIQKGYNELYARIANDQTFLAGIMRDLGDVDDFTKSLWELHLEVQSDLTAAGRTEQDIYLGMFRSDYLVHAQEGLAPQIKQVEFNTVSSSFAGLATRTAELHRSMVKQGAYGPNFQATLADLPKNPATEGLAAGLAAAHSAYGVKDAIVLFVVQPGERNAFDQRWLEYALLETHGVHSVRLTLADVQSRTSTDESGKLRIGGVHTPTEVAVVYYRAGYSPDDYPSAEEWRGRKTLEASAAIKCPTLLTQLAGSKKVQQVLTDAGMVERFVDTKESADLVRSTFVKLHTLDTTEAGKEARRLALEQPERYVLKPSREGGGNNIYRDKIPEFLRTIPERQWPGYILMELILPPDRHNAIVRAGELFPATVVSELGIYGAVVWDKQGKILYNEPAGHLLRTKSKETDEGGVAAGFACIDSPWLTD